MPKSLMDGVVCLCDCAVHVTGRDGESFNGGGSGERERRAIFFCSSHAGGRRTAVSGVVDRGAGSGVGERNRRTELLRSSLTRRGHGSIGGVVNCCSGGAVRKGNCLSCGNCTALGSNHRRRSLLESV